METRVKRYRNPSQRLDKWGYLFIAPFIIVFLVFSLYPMIYSIILSFTNTNYASHEAFENFRAFDNYLWIFSPKLVQAYNKIFLSKIPNNNLFAISKHYLDEITEGVEVSELSGNKYVGRHFG